MSLTLKILGKPIAKKRPRFFRRGNFVGTYSDQKTEESKFMMEVKAQLPDGWLRLSGQVEIGITFGMPIPKSMPKSKSSQILAGATVYHDKKPDLDNLVKFVLDCLREYVIGDDSCVVALRSYKQYSEQPYTLISVERISQ